MNWFDDWALTLAVFIPAVGMAIVLLIPRAQEELIKIVTLLTSLVTLGVGIAILADFNYDRGGLQFTTNESWIDVIHSRYHLGIDGISLPLLVLSMFITVVCVIYSWNHFPEPHNPKAFLALVLLLEIGMNGTFVAQDLILFFIFFEIVLLPMFFMIGVWGGPNREYASIKFFLFTLFGSAMMLLSFVALFFLSKVHTFDMVVLTQLHGAGIVHSTQVLLFAGLFLGFAIKVPMFPFHTWLPDAHTEAPTVGSVLLAAILLKLGAYGFIRIALPILPEAAQTWAPWIGLLAVIGIIYGALGCLAQRDMKRLIAFSSIAHMGFVMLGIATLTTSVSTPRSSGWSRTGSSPECSSSSRDRSRSASTHASSAGSVGSSPRPRTWAGSSASARWRRSGLPGLAGFWGEFPAILSAYDPTKPDGLWGGSSGTLWTFRIYMVIAAIGTVLAAGYLLWMFQRVAFGKVKTEFADLHVHDVHGPEWIAWTPLLSSSSCSASTRTSCSRSPILR